MIPTAAPGACHASVAAAGWKPIGALSAVLILAACGSTPSTRSDNGPAGGNGPAVAEQGTDLPCAVPSSSLKLGGGYYLDDGPGSSPPANLGEVPDAVPRPEPLRAANTKPYEALGKRYTPMTELRPYKVKGLASWYGRRYHGRRTASGEIYDMYGMTAAHPILPIPSYVRVTNLSNGRSVVVRVNDRGPFHPDRVIDLSFTAACRLDLVAGGSGLVQVETIIPGEPPPAEAAEVPRLVDSARSEQPRMQSVAVAPRTAEPNGAAVPVVTVMERENLLTTLSQTEESRPPGVYLQLGAFGARENADNFLSHLRSELAGLEDALFLSHQGGLYRVEAGPYPSASDARLSAERIARTVGFTPLLTSR